MTRALNWLLAAALVLALWLRDPLIGLIVLLLALLAGVTALWARYALVGVTYERRLGARQLFAGDATELVVEITNAKPLSLPWLRADDEFPAEMELARGRLYASHRANRRLLTNLLALRFYERVRKQYHLVALKRGVLLFGPVRLRAGDASWPATVARIGNRVELVTRPTADAVTGIEARFVEVDLAPVRSDGVPAVSGLEVIVRFAP